MFRGHAGQAELPYDIRVSSGWATNAVAVSHSAKVIKKMSAQLNTCLITSKKKKRIKKRGHKLCTEVSNRETNISLS